MILQAEHYFQHYIGCKCHDFTEDRIAKLAGVILDQEEPLMLSYGLCVLKSRRYSEVKLILKRLADINDWQLAQLLGLTAGAELSKYVQFSQLHVTHHRGRFSQDIDPRKKGLEETFVIELDSSKMKLTTQQQTFLFSAGFDTAGLIDAGLAIDASRLGIDRVADVRK